MLKFLKDFLKFKKIVFVFVFVFVFICYSFNANKKF